MKAFLMLLCILNTISANAQTISIKGRVLDQNGIPLSNVTIMIMARQDKVLTKAGISGVDGNFYLTGVKRGSYILKISSTGLETYYQNLDSAITDLETGDIKLMSIATNLDAVKIVSDKPMVQVLADKTVFNVENTINASGTNGWELLRKAPGLMIDNSGSIIVEGKAGVQIYIDGKPSPLRGADLKSFLESLQSADISSIEIITQPSSKYDAAGNAGIINIRLKKNKNFGTNGSATAAITHGKYARYSTSLSFNNRTKTGNLYGTLSNGTGKNSSFLYLFRKQNDVLFDARTETKVTYINNNVRLGYDLFASAKSTLGVILNGSVNSNDIRSDSRTPIFASGAPQADSILIANNKTQSGVDNYNINLNYRFADTLGHSLNIDADYGRYVSDRNAYQPNFYYNSAETLITSQNITRQETPIAIDIATAKADYEQNFLKGKLSIGFKISQVKTANVFDFYNLVSNSFELDKNQSNQFNYTEKINAAFANYNRKWQKWNVQAGVRMEHTISDGKLNSTQSLANNRVKRRYTNFFPSGGITWQADKNSQLSFTYSKRIERPNYASLNPFVYKLDELSFSRGNPFLQPQYTDNIKISHTYKYKLNTSISYSYIRDFFAQITEAEGERKNFLSQRNIANQTVVNLGVAYPAKVNSWWDVYFSLNVFKSSYAATNPDFVAISQETLSFYAQNTFKLPWKTSAEVSGWYSSPSVWGGTYETKSLGSLNIAFEKRIIKSKLTTRLGFNDILFTSPWKGNTRFGNLVINGSGGSDSRTVVVSAAYNFGNDTVKKSRSRKTGLEEESNRVGN